MTWPRWLGASPGVDAHVFALFLGTSLSISALPVVVKAPMDLDLLRTDLGLLVVASAVAQDLLGWLAFAVVLSLIGATGTEQTLTVTLSCALALVVGILSWVAGCCTAPCRGWRQSRRDQEPCSLSPRRERCSAAH